jgi:hypothetical protein
LEETISGTKGEINKYQGQGVNSDNQRKRILGDLEKRLTKTEVTANQYEDKYSQANQTINSLKQGIQSIFDKIGCDDEVTKEMLGNAGVTESNMMQYLGIIEQRGNELLQLYEMQQAKEAPEQRGDYASGDLNPALTINAPSSLNQGGYEEASEEDEGFAQEEQL